MGVSALTRDSGRAPRRFLRRTSAAVAVTALAVGLLLKVAAPPSGAQGNAPPVDPRLVIDPATVPVTGALGTQALRGALYPALPGPNRLRVTIAGYQPREGDRMALAVTMPGMQMAPLRIHLVPSARGFSGTLTLPMFGTYRAHLTLIAGTTRQTGTASLVVPLNVEDPAELRGEGLPTRRDGGADGAHEHLQEEQDFLTVNTAPSSVAASGASLIASQWVPRSQTVGNPLTPTYRPGWIAIASPPGTAA